MCCNAGTKTTNGVSPDGFPDEFPVAKGVEHCGVGTEVSAPAHAHGGEYGDSIVIDDTGINKGRNEAQSRSYSA